MGRALLLLFFGGLIALALFFWTSRPIHHSPGVHRWQSAPPIPAKEIAAHCSNNHLIPASATVARAVRRLRLGEIAELRGWLVDVAGPAGFAWRTSRQRGDSGNGACEVFYVEEIKSVPPLRSGTSQGIALAR